jgi:hypothetical protein
MDKKHTKTETTMHLASACLIMSVMAAEPQALAQQVHPGAINAKSVRAAAPVVKRAAVVAQEAQGPKLLVKQGAWSVYVHDAPNNDRVCFATSRPRRVEPKGVKRGPVYFYVTTWRKDNVRAEISVRLGYTVKTDVAPTITVGAERFELFGRNDKAFTRDPQEEKRLLDAMLKASALTVKGMSARGTATADQYSLHGLSAAMKVVDQSCR